MAKKSKVFIKNPHGLCDFFWANTSRDGSVILGTTASYNGRQYTHSVFERGKELRNGDYFVGTSLGQSKITFHQSGYYKLSTIIGKTKESLDRGTVRGVPLSKINTPRRMLEVVLPNKLKHTTKKITNRDVVIQAESFLNKPYRCSVWCADMDYFEEWSKSQTKVVDTSLIESSAALVAGNLAWVFTLRQSATDKYVNNEFTFYVPGKMVWGRITQT